jgi:hypothetical protein
MNSKKKFLILKTSISLLSSDEIDVYSKRRVNASSYALDNNQSLQPLRLKLNASMVAMN